MAIFQGFISPILDPLLNLHPLLAIVILSFSISLIITLVYKFTTNQKLMKDLKTEMKEFQKEIKELKAHPEKAMAVQKKSMQTNMKYMSHSMRSTLFTMLPVIIIFGWMNANLAFLPLEPGMEFTTTISLYDGQHGSASLISTNGLEIIGDAKKDIVGNAIMWTLKGDAGDYLLEYTVNEIKYNKEVTITRNHKYAQPIKTVNDKVVKSISINNEKNKPLNLFGWKLGWLGTYIIFSIVCSSLLRKLMKVY